MKYHEFLKLLLSLDSSLQNSLYKKAWDGRVSPIENPVIEQEWLTHRYEGGNCWNDLEPEYYDDCAEPEPGSFIRLQNILRQIAPGCTEEQFQQLCKERVKEYTRHDPQYYGNSDHYRGYRIHVPQLFSWLNKNKLLKG